MSESGASRAVTIGGALASIWQRHEGSVFALSQATHGLTLLMTLLRPGEQVWVPAYFCDNGLGPVRNSAARLRLYPMTSSMAPDWTGCETMLADGVPKLFVLPHFFGVENEAEAARAFCDRTGAWLLEDAAHVLRPVGRIGAFGDFATYSPRKFLPIPDGGLLVVRGSGLSAQLAAAASELASRELSLWRWRALDLRERLLPRREVVGPLGPRQIDDEPPRSTDLPAVWMSPFSRHRMLRLGPAGISAIERAELEVVARANEAVPTATGLVPLPRNPGTTPYLLGFRARSVEAAASAVNQLRAAGAPVDVWPGMPPEVWAEPQRYGAALELRRTILRFTPRRKGRRNPLRFLDNLDD